MEQLKKELKERLEKYSSNEKFEVGDFVRLREELRNTKYPAEGECGIVVRVLDTPERNQYVSSGSAIFTEILDIHIGVLVDDNFMIYAYESRRLQKV